MSSGLPAAPAHRPTPRDLVAGISVALVAIPQGLAYAELAGLPGHHGLYAVAFPLMAAALFASSPYLQTGPVATTALLTFGALVPLAAPGSAEFVALAALLAVIVGVARIAVGVFRAGWLSYLMSRPVLEGFMAGAAILIIASQLPGALGGGGGGGGVLRSAAHVLSRPGSWEAGAIAFSVGTIAVIAGARRIGPGAPGVLVAAVAGLLISRATGYEGAVVGAIPRGLPPLTLDLPWARLPELVLPGAVIALVGFAEAASISRAFASEARERWDANREFVSQGAANLVSGLSGGFPVGGSFARSSLNRMAGATSRWAGFVTGAAVLLFLPFAGVLAALPRAVLAGIVIAAVSGLVRPRRLLGLWSLSRTQAVVGWTTFGLTLALAPRVDEAVLLGVLAAGAAHLLQELVVTVRAERDGDTLRLTASGVLWFASAPALDDEILRHLSDQRDVTRVVVNLSGLGRVDLTGAWTLAEMLDQLREAGLEVSVEGVPHHARRALRGAGADPGG